MDSFNIINPLQLLLSLHDRRLNNQPASNRQQLSDTAHVLILKAHHDIISFLGSNRLTLLTTKTRIVHFKTKLGRRRKHILKIDTDLRFMLDYVWPLRLRETTN